MKLSSSEMFGRGRHQTQADAARADGARADQAAVDETTAPRQAYANEATAARPTFTPAGDDDVADAPTPMRAKVVSDTPVTPADDGLADRPVARTTRMAYDRPAVSAESAYDEPEAYDRSVAYDEPGYNERAGQPMPAATVAAMGTSTVADGVEPAEGTSPALDPDESTTPTGVASPTGTSAGVPAPRQATRMADRPGSALTAGPMADLDQPLFSDAEFQSRWQRVQAGFVDDPHVAVSEAADLVEQAGQALADALRERQTRLRALWDNDADGTGQGEAGAATASGVGDTEELRLMMRRYRGLFDQLSHL